MDKEYLITSLSNIAGQHGVSISKELLGEIVSISSFRVVNKGEVIRNVTEKNTTAALVLAGMCRAFYVDEDGNDITRGFSIPGTLCMDEGMFGYSESIVTWETLEETTLMVFEVAKMKQIILLSHELKNIYIKLLENALQYKIYRENGFLVESASERYLHFKKLYPMICNKVKQQHLASYLGIKPESLSRIRKALKESHSFPE